MIYIPQLFARIIESMAQTPDNFDDISSIVPERDELVSHRRRNRSTATASVQPSSAQEVYASQTSSTVIFLLTFLVLGFFASVGTGYYFYQSDLATNVQLIESNSRIAQLESSLNDMDVATSQSALGLMEKVEFNFTEIDKLWAARNTLKTESETLVTTVAALKTTVTSIEAAVTTHGSMLNQHTNQVAAIRERLEDINKNFAGMDDLGQQLTVINADLNRVKASMNSVEADVEKRLSTAEEDIESINVYRLQLNQTMAALQTSINTLQQRVGQ